MCLWSRLGDMKPVWLSLVVDDICVHLLYCLAMLAIASSPVIWLPDLWPCYFSSSELQILCAQKITVGGALVVGVLQPSLLLSYMINESQPTSTHIFIGSNQLVEMVSSVFRPGPYFEYSLINGKGFLIRQIEFQSPYPQQHRHVKLSTKDTRKTYMRWHERLKSRGA